MNKSLFHIFLLLVAIVFPFGVHADELASTTPETVGSASDVLFPLPPTEPLTAPVKLPAVATSTEPLAPSVEIASSTEPLATSTEPLVPVIPPSVPITLALETQSGTLFKGLLTVTACRAAPDAPLTVSGFCAVEQSGVPATWSWYGSDAFIDTIGSVGNDYAEGVYWNWFSDLSYGMTSLNAHSLHPGESLIVSIGRMPLRIAATPEEAVVGSTTTVTVSAFGFDSSFEPVWEPAASSTVLINDVPFLTASDGTVLYIPTESGELTITATKDGFLPATGISISIREAPDLGTGNEGGTSQPADAVDAAVRFLRGHQRPDGSFTSPLLSDWAAIAFASASTPSRPLREYLMTASDTLETATDFERRAMALAALGINPEDAIQKIVERFDGTQVGERSLLNDDIFALIALAQGGHVSSDPVIEAVVATLIESQQENGAWTSTDLTAAGIQALAPFSSLPGVLSATDKARRYLVSRIDADGCFGNSFVTSWGVMAIHALGESPDAWLSPNGATPLSCLKAAQAPDGGFEEGASTDMRIWATAYAIPALSGETWHDVLKRFPKPERVTEKVKQAKEEEILPKESVEFEATTTLPMLSEITVQEIAPPSVPVRKPETKKDVVSQIPRTALVASALSAIEPVTANAPEESLWMLLVSFVKSVFALIFPLSA